MPEWITPDWPAPPHVKAAATLRTGGVSEGPFASLNLGSHVGDEPAAVSENRRLLAAELALPAEPTWLNQVHGINVVDAATANIAPRLAAMKNAVFSTAGTKSNMPPASSTGETKSYAPAVSSAAEAKSNGPAASSTTRTKIKMPTASSTAGAQSDGPAPSFAANNDVLSGPPTADASVALGPGAVCAVMTADCLPVLFCDRAGTRVGAAHAGWRGLVGGVLGATIKALGVEPSQLMAWLGPAIEQEAFEVGEEVHEQFLKLAADNAAAFRANARGRWQADLYQLARNELARLGVSAVYGGGFNVFADDARFFSYRRANPTGRMATLVWLDTADRDKRGDADAAERN